LLLPAALATAQFAKELATIALSPSVAIFTFDLLSERGGGATYAIALVHPSVARAQNPIRALQGNAILLRGGGAAPLVAEVLPSAARAGPTLDTFLALNISAAATLASAIENPSISVAESTIRALKLDASVDFAALVPPKVLVLAMTVIPGPAAVAPDFWLIVRTGGAALFLGRLLIGRDHPPTTFTVLVFEAALTMSPLGSAAFIATYGLPTGRLAPFSRIVHILACDVGAIVATLFFAAVAGVPPSVAFRTPVSGNTAGRRAGDLLSGLIHSHERKKDESHVLGAKPRCRSHNGEREKRR